MYGLTNTHPTFVADFANHFACVDQLPANNTIGVKQVRIHVHVAHAHVRVLRIDEQIDSLLLACA